MILEPNFFESMRFNNGKINLLEKHFLRIENNAKLIGAKLDFNSNEFEEFITKENTQNIEFAKARVKFKVENNLLRLFNVEITPILATDINSAIPIDICIYSEQFKDQNKYSNSKVENSIIYNDSIEFALKRGFHHSVILNPNFDVVETSIASIYFIKNGAIYTPPLSTGCVSGVMRNFLMENFTIQEKIIKSNDIQNYDEVFLSNAVRGIIFINNLDNHKFKSLLSNEIREKLILLTQ